MEITERPQCCIDRCLTKTKSIKVKDIIYYLFPTDADWAHKWEMKIKDFDPRYRRKSNHIVCSLHFAKSSMQPISRQLVDHALPIYFPQKATTTQPLPQQKSTKPVPDSTSTESKCCITGCPTKFDDTDPKIAGFKFPDSEEQRKKWMFIIELYNNQKIEWNKSMRVCALHFASACFTMDDKLTDGAKPSIFKSAIACRQKEIAKQQTQTTHQQASPTKTHSINVPLHKKNADNHSMTRRSAPVIARRLSLPYSKLPPLLPKPNIQVLKRPNPVQMNSVNVANKLQRISLPNGRLTPVSTARANINATAKRPVPALTKVNVVPNPQFVAKGNVSVLRKSMPSPQMNKLSLSQAIVARLDNGTAKLIPVSTSSAAHITRLPPTLKPAPRPVITLPKGTYIETQIPKISRVQSIPNVQPKVVAKVMEHPMPILSKAPEKVATVSSPVVEERRVPDVIVIEDEEVEIAMAIKTSEDTDDANATTTNKNDDQKPLYTVQDERAFKFPRMLLARIIEKKRQNDEFSTELTKWKKIALKMNQQYRLQRATTSMETIDIS
ncbi:uncharacterized protein LOC129574899 [Sitodiplosis mosellana]|uniref:uncharacterized protein LOC129574899 n=1 Tax=Sitodiplosis mosellana TaxID=263140 RepID=UPI002444F08D|nr:uncharacterized protein LOC129574899 [Sitodiplosis mosellana]XP_055313514.1 uncharacterized protein LOC129574899 [Sitodiplosis mosellana]